MHHGLFVIPNCNPGHTFIQHTSPKDMKKITEMKMLLGSPKIKYRNTEILQICG